MTFASLQLKLASLEVGVVLPKHAFEFTIGDYYEGAYFPAVKFTGAHAILRDGPAMITYWLGPGNGTDAFGNFFLGNSTGGEKQYPANLIEAHFRVLLARLADEAAKPQPPETKPTTIYAVVEDGRDPISMRKVVRCDDLVIARQIAGLLAIRQALDLEMVTPKGWQPHVTFVKEVQIDPRHWGVDCHVQIDPEGGTMISEWTIHQSTALLQAELPK